MTDNPRDTETDDDEPVIVYREPFIDEKGVQDYRIHRVPLADWPEYERKHGL